MMWTSMVDLGPFAMGTFATWNSLVNFPVLRMSSGFPTTCSVMSSLQEQTCQVIGMTCLKETLTIDELSAAAEVRSAMIIELQQLPVWLEARIEMIPANQRPIGRLDTSMQ